MSTMILVLVGPGSAIAADAIEQLRAFVVFPLIGGAVGWLAYRLIHSRPAAD